MKAKTIETWVWVLIYGGLLATALGGFSLAADAVLGWIVISLGAVAVAVGVLLVYLRSRMKP